MDVPRRHEAVHVYGVDLLSTGDLLKYFADYGGWVGGRAAGAADGLFMTGCMELAAVGALHGRRSAPPAWALA